MRRSYKYAYKSLYASLLNVNSNIKNTVIINGHNFVSLATTSETVVNNFFTNATKKLINMYTYCHHSYVDCHTATLAGQTLLSVYTSIVLLVHQP